MSPTHARAPETPQVAADADVVAFWNHFEGQIDAGWQLPPLCYDALITLITDLIWWVTAGHEFVGAIVEYLTPPNGLPAKIVDGRTDVDVQSYAQARARQLEPLSR